ncbi:MAG: hypothetical protein CL424_14305, partial [Acidimicrobiaceae bacterium]|nr:hypothetical protein [Acidimicrobiaceae bacterium]
MSSLVMTARVVDPADAPDALVENCELRERVSQLEDERNRLWAQIIGLQAELRPCATEPPTPERRSDVPSSDLPISRAERRRREREAARRGRRR